MNINERIKQIKRISFDNSTKKFASALNISSQAVSNYTRNGYNVGREVIENIIKVCPTINSNWLLTGEGDMFKFGYNNIYTSIGSNNMGLVGENSGTYIAMSDPAAKKIIDGSRIEITREVYTEEKLLQEINRLKAEIEGLKSTLKSKEDLINEKDRTIDTLNRMIELLSK